MHIYANEIKLDVASRADTTAEKDWRYQGVIRMQSDSLRLIIVDIYSASQSIFLFKYVTWPHFLMQDPLVGKTPYFFVTVCFFLDYTW